jgi:hypothetical protein
MATYVARRSQCCRCRRRDRTAGGRAKRPPHRRDPVRRNTAVCRGLAAAGGDRGGQSWSTSGTSIASATLSFPLSAETKPRRTKAFVSGSPEGPRLHRRQSDRAGLALVSSPRNPLSPIARDALSSRRAQASSARPLIRRANPSPWVYSVCWLMASARRFACAATARSASTNSGVSPSRSSSPVRIIAAASSSRESCPALEAISGACVVPAARNSSSSARRHTDPSRADTDGLKLPPVDPLSGLGGYADWSGCDGSLVGILVPGGPDN